MGMPFSRVTSSLVARARDFSATAMALSRSARAAGGVARQPGSAERAAATASSMSAALALAPSPRGSPVAASMTGVTSSLGRNRPPM